MVAGGVSSPYSPLNIEVKLRHIEVEKITSMVSLWRASGISLGIGQILATLLWEVDEFIMSDN